MNNEFGFSILIPILLLALTGLITQNIYILQLDKLNYLKKVNNNDIEEAIFKRKVVSNEKIKTENLKSLYLINKKLSLYRRNSSIYSSMPILLSDEIKSEWQNYIPQKIVQQKCLRLKKVTPSILKPAILCQIKEIYPSQNIESSYNLEIESLHIKNINSLKIKTIGSLTIGTLFFDGPKPSNLMVISSGLIINKVISKVKVGHSIEVLSGNSKIPKVLGIKVKQKKLRKERHAFSIL
jgi:hypothetical protein